MATTTISLACPKQDKNQQDQMMSAPSKCPQSPLLGCRIRWTSLTQLKDMLHPLLELHSSVGILRLYRQRIELQVVSRQQTAVMERVLTAGSDYRIEWGSCVDGTGNVQVADKNFDDQCLCCIAVQLSAWESTLLETTPLILTLLPGVHLGVTWEGDVAQPEPKEVVQSRIERAKLVDLPANNVKSIQTSQTPSSTTTSKATNKSTTSKATTSKTINKTGNKTTISIKECQEERTQPKVEFSTAVLPVTTPLMEKNRRCKAIESSVEWIWTWDNNATTQIVQRTSPADEWMRLPVRASHYKTFVVFPSQFLGCGKNDENVEPTEKKEKNIVASLSTTHLSQLQADFLDMSIFQDQVCLRLDSRDKSWEWGTQNHQWSHQCTFAHNAKNETENMYQSFHRICTTLSEWTTWELWERHQYSLSDIRKTLESMNEKLIWQLMLGLQLPAPNAATLATLDVEESISFGTKGTAITKIMSLLESHPATKSWQGRPHVVWDMTKQQDPNGDQRPYDVNQRHHPCLPVHRLTRVDYDAIKFQHQDILVWRGIWIVVLEENSDGTLMTMGRVIPFPSSSSDSSLTPGFSFATQPRIVQRGNPLQQLQCCEETFFFYSPPAWNASFDFSSTTTAHVQDANQLNKRIRVG